MQSVYDHLLLFFSLHFLKRTVVSAVLISIQIQFQICTHQMFVRIVHKMFRSFSFNLAFSFHFAVTFVYTTITLPTISTYLNQTICLLATCFASYTMRKKIMPNTRNKSKHMQTQANRTMDSVMLNIQVYTNPNNKKILKEN